MKTLTALVLFFLSNMAFAHSSHECTTEPKEKWLNQKEFQTKLEADYDIKKFKVLEHCYEIYGKDKKTGEKVEIYFNPVDGSVFKKEVD